MYFFPVYPFKTFVSIISQAHPWNPFSNVTKSNCFSFSFFFFLQRMCLSTYLSISVSIYLSITESSLENSDFHLYQAAAFSPPFSLIWKNTPWKLWMYLYVKIELEDITVEAISVIISVLKQVLSQPFSIPLSNLLFLFSLAPIIDKPVYISEFSELLC